MPYISKVEREAIDRGEAGPDTPGTLSYAITRDIQHFLDEAGQPGHYKMKGYAAYAIVAGVLVLTLFEFVRRIVNPYEDNKIAINGDVY